MARRAVVADLATDAYPITMVADHFSRWMTLVVVLPTENAAARMNVLRTVESLGAAVLREGVYLLPDDPARRASFERLADYIRAAMGEAQLLDVTAHNVQQDADFRRRFERRALYLEIGKTVSSLANAYGISDPSALARVLQRQRDEFERVAAIDFFGSPEKDTVADLLASTDDAIRGLMFPTDAVGGERVGARADYFQREWATRMPWQIDRLASAWLIRRFIDAEARLAVLDKHAAPAAKTVTFGFDGAAFANSRNRVTYEELLKFFQLDQDAALARIGQLVKAITSGDVSVAQAAGIETLLRGAMDRATDQNALLNETDRTFDLLYDR